MKESLMRTKTASLYDDEIDLWSYENTKLQTRTKR